jgi:hypothetical protein
VGARDAGKPRWVMSAVEMGRVGGGWAGPEAVGADLHPPFRQQSPGVTDKMALLPAVGAGSPSSDKS